MIRSTKKIAVLITTVAFFTSVPIAAGSEDCSQYVKLHKKLMCMAGSDVSDSGETKKKAKKAKKAKKVKEENPDSINVKYNTIGKLIEALQNK